MSSVDLYVQSTINPLKEYILKVISQKLSEEYSVTVSVDKLMEWLNLPVKTSGNIAPLFNNYLKPQGQTSPTKSVKKKKPVAKSKIEKMPQCIHRKRKGDNPGERCSNTSVSGCHGYCKNCFSKRSVQDILRNKKSPNEYPIITDDLLTFSEYDEELIVTDHPTKKGYVIYEDHIVLKRGEGGALIAEAIRRNDDDYPLTPNAIELSKKKGFIIIN